MTLLCQNTINNLQEATGDVFQEILDIYLKDAQQNIKSMISSSLSHDADQLLRLAHTLKGSSRNIGASELADLCETFEKDLRNGEHGNLEQRVTMISSSFENTLPLLQKYLTWDVANVKADWFRQICTDSLSLSACKMSG